MFVLTSISDLIPIDPKDFTKPTPDAIKDNIHSKYSNKVLQQVGLCICVFDIEKISDGLIGHGSGIVYVHVDFRLLVFRPFKGEILQGRIIRSDENAIKIGLEFFEDITAPAPTSLFEDTTFDAKELSWVWTPEGGDGELYFDLGEVIRFRVESEEWHDRSPQAPGSEDSGKDDQPPYSLLVSMQQSGLGLTMWWDEERAEEAEQSHSPT
ncbi:DNA-directed RNA polymerase III polypeptide [Pseudovirgaria hyperparasitica]|uniref:DNA-directed RNA polymerase subunit n=1 Tax=Pseudovirgaria hyperparasitica TaxID=470096 RepID=A0A6A6VV69_9PEZI|nr:DNA-directed RNA polymerase III polypeptide [Pseudovirgaria hyperparasitica]KAF2754123.1 DNA-directed RNA polymerase III polypeptide [Pseudovirgaria hyperparasitica]